MTKQYKLTQETITSFAKQLQALVSSGLPLFKAIQVITAQTKNNTYQKALEQIQQELSEGKTLSESLTKTSSDFSPFFINMIKVGENHGELDKALERIYLHLEKMRENKQKIINALTYPIILLISSLSILTLMMFFVLPKFITIFDQATIKLPLPTRILFFINRVLHNYYPHILVLIAILTVTILFLRKKPQVRELIDKYTMRFPLVGELSKVIYIARFCRTFGILYQSGVSLLESISLSKPNLTNKILIKEINKVIKSVQNGEGVAQPIAQSKVFPPMMSQMIAVGEQSGNLAKSLSDIASYYEQETDYKIKKQLSLIEPISLMIISTIVAFTAAAIMLPLFKMAGAVRAF